MVNGFPGHWSVFQMSEGFVLLPPVDSFSISVFAAAQAGVSWFITITATTTLAWKMECGAIKRQRPGIRLMVRENAPPSPHKSHSSSPVQEKGWNIVYGGFGNDCIILKIAWISAQLLNTDRSWWSSPPGIFLQQENLLVLFKFSLP